MSPFFAAAAESKSDVGVSREEKCTVATATASRVDGDFEAIETIFASPEEERCVNLSNAESSL
jgi:hypothetical protein